MKNNEAKDKETTQQTNILQAELKKALEFLKNNPIGERLQVAEHALSLLVKDELPHLRQCIFNASFDLREISNIQRFEKLIYSEDKLDEFIKESRCGGYFRVRLEEEKIRMTLFYDKKVTKNEAVLYSRAVGEIIAVTYAALGLDMTGLVAVDTRALQSKVA